MPNHANNQYKSTEEMFRKKAIFSLQQQQLTNRNRCKNS